ncbi:MAG: PKD domain-containing protein [Bacteroidota bacterium]
MIRFQKYHSSLLFRILLLLILAGCQRENIIDRDGDVVPGETRMDPSTLVLDTNDLTNPVRTNGQVRFDIIGEMPGMQKGDHLFYPLGEGIFGTVAGFSLTDSRVTVDLTRSGLETVWTDMVLVDSITQDSFSARTRFLPQAWNRDTMQLDGIYLFDELWGGKSLRVHILDGKFANGYSITHKVSGAGSDPWLKRYSLATDYDALLAVDVMIESGGALDARDSLLVEETVHGPFYSGNIPVFYKVRSYIGFHVVMESDTTILFNFSAREKGSAVLVNNHWSDWDISHTVDYELFEVLSRTVSKFTGSYGEIFLYREITPVYCGEYGVQLVKRLFASVGSEVDFPDWSISQDMQVQICGLKAGKAFSIAGESLPEETIVLVHGSESGTTPNQAPKAVFTINPSVGYTDTNFEFDANGCSDLETESGLLEVRWDFDSDSHFDTEFSTSKTVLHLYPQPGIYQPVLEVKDAAGLTSRISKPVEVNLSSSAPIAHFNVNPETGRITDYFVFDASGCYDAQDDINQLKVRWDFDGDGLWDTSFSKTKAEVHFYTEPGNYMPKLEVMDTEGLSGSTTRLIKVGPANIKPTALFTVDPETGTIETEFNFDASGSSDTEDSSDKLRVRWDWNNDGVYDTGYSTGKIITHIFSTAGTFTVVLEVTDTEDYIGTVSKPVVVTNLNQPPVADFSINPASGTIETRFAFDASACTDAEDSPELLEVRWDWDNDNVYDTEFTVEKIFERTFPVPGTYIIKVQVRDTQGLLDSKARTLLVR